MDLTTLVDFKGTMKHRLNIRRTMVSFPMRNTKKRNSKRIISIFLSFSSKLSKSVRLVFPVPLEGSMVWPWMPRRNTSTWPGSRRAATASTAGMAWSDGILFYVRFLLRFLRVFFFFFSAGDCLCTTFILITCVQERSAVYRGKSFDNFRSFIIILRHMWALMGMFW